MVDKACREEHLTRWQGSVTKASSTKDSSCRGEEIHVILTPTTNCVTSDISTLLLTIMSRHSVMTPLVITLCVDYHVPDPLHKRGGTGGQMYGDGLEHGAEQSIIQKPIKAIEKQVSKKGRTNKLFNNCHKFLSKHFWHKLSIVFI